MPVITGCVCESAGPAEDCLLTQAGKFKMKQPQAEAQRQMRGGDIPLSYYGS